MNRRNFLQTSVYSIGFAFFPLRLKADPVTLGTAAAFVGIELLKGAISYVGGSVLSHALGAATINDVHTWILEAVAELEAFVSDELKKQLDDKVVEQLRSNLSGIITDLNQYASLKEEDQKNNIYLLQNCDIKTADLIPLSLNYDQALFITSAAMAYRLNTLWSLFQIDNDPGHISSAKDMMDTYVKTSTDIRNKIFNSMSPDSHFTINCKLASRHTDAIMGCHSRSEQSKPSCTVTTFGCQILQDGNVVDGLSGSPKISTSIINQANTKKNDLIAQSSYKKNQTNFYDQANSSIVLAVNCYDEMCKKIGLSYTSPV